MTRSTYLTISFVVAIALAAPDLAGGQAIPRGGSTSSGGSSSGGSGGSGSSGGGSGSSGSSSSGGSEGRSAPTTSRSGDDSGRAPSRIPTGTSGSSSRTGGGAIARPAPGGVVAGGSTSSITSSSAARSGEATPAISRVSGRERGDRAAIGSAIARPDTQLISFPLFGPWGRWYPWYSNGFGWNLGFVTYNPWRYGATRWVWGRYGMWYDPYAYDPYWHGASYGSYGSSGSRRTEEPKRLVGSIRLKVDPEDAKVYIDGALVGTADEFNGLRHHLELDGGRHELELRAEGYETYKSDLNVEAGKTRTERVKLKKIK